MKETLNCHGHNFNIFHSFFLKIVNRLIAYSGANAQLQIGSDYPTLVKLFFSWCANCLCLVWDSSAAFFPIFLQSKLNLDLGGLTRLPQTELWPQKRGRIWTGKKMKNCFLLHKADERWLDNKIRNVLIHHMKWDVIRQITLRFHFADIQTVWNKSFAKFWWFS